MSRVPNRPLVSVIMPTYNHATFLRQAIDSVLSQTYDKLELIVIDNYSSDNTAEIASAFQDKRVRFFQFRNQGVIAAARNYGIHKAEGETIAFLDADDEWLPEKLRIQLAHLLTSKLAGVSTNFIPTGQVVYCKNHLSFPRGQSFRDFGYDALVLKNAVMTSSLIARTADLLDLGGFDQSRDFRFIEDWELWLRLSQRGPIRVLKEPLIYYRVQKKPERDLQEVSSRTRHIMEKHLRCRLLSQELYRKALGNCSVEIGRACLETNDRKGIGYFLKALRHSVGFTNRARALIGVVLFCLPFSLRLKLMEMLYRVRYLLASQVTGSSRYQKLTPLQ